MKKLILKQSLTTAAMNTAMNYISDNPEKNLPKLLRLLFLPLYGRGAAGAKD